MSKERLVTKLRMKHLELAICKKVLKDQVLETIDNQEREVLALEFRMARLLWDKR